MKVLWFANTPCGATEKLTGNKVIGGGWLFSLSEALKSYSDIELHIAFYWGYAMSAFTHEGIHYHPIFRGGNDSKFGRYVCRIRQLYSDSEEKKELNRVNEIIKIIQPDIIHFHGSEENFGMVANRVVGIPMVLSIQGLLNPIRSKLYSGYQRNDALKYEGILRKMLFDGFKANELRLNRKCQREHEILRLVPNIIGRTNWDHDCSLAFNANRRYFVCNELLREQFMKSTWRTPPSIDKIILTTTTSGGLYKGLEMIYETSRVLYSQNISFEWNVIGVSNGDSFDKMTRKVTGLAPESLNINLLGRRNADGIIDILKESHVFIQVSHIENSPNTLCEAMVLGMPIIASFAGGTSSMLEDGKEGVLIQDGDPYRLAGAIIEMKTSYTKALVMGENARKRALIRHDVKNVTSELISIYNNLLNE